MISGLGFTFVILPCIGAVAIAALLKDWRLAAAAVCGSLGAIFIAPYAPDGIRLIASPVLFGMAIGAAAVMIRLWLRPSADIWSRMIWAIVVTAVITFTPLLMLLNGA